MPHYRIDQGIPLNGEILGAEFVDGVYDGELTTRQIASIGANYVLERVLDDGTSYQVSSIAVDPAAIEFVQQLRDQEMQIAAEEVSASQLDQMIASDNVDQSTLSGNALYTREYLEGIADSEGIAGLRVIATKHDIKAKSIADIINALLSVTG